MTDKTIKERNEKGTGAWTDRCGIARHYQVSLRTVAKFTQGRVLPSTKIGRVVRYNVGRCDEAMLVFERASVALKGGN